MWAIPAAGQNSITCDIAHCIRIALDESPELAVTRIEIEAADAAIRKQKAASRPDLGLTLSASEIHGRPTGPFSVLNVPEADTPNNRVDFAETSLVEVDLSYPLYADGSLLGMNSSSVASAVTQKESVVWLSQSTREGIIYQLVAAYIDLLSKRDLAQMDEEGVRIAREKLAVIEREVALNLKPESQAELSRAQLAVAEETLASARRDFEMARTLLARLVGAESPSEIVLDGTLPDAPELPLLDGLTEQVLRSHPDLGVQRAAVDQTRAELSLARSGRLPSLFLEGSYTYADDFSPPGNDLFQAQVRLEIPLVDFGERRATVAESELRLKAEEKRIKAVERAVINGLIQSYSVISASRGAIAVLEKELSQAEFDLKFTRARQKEGQAGPLSVLASETQLLDARKTLSQAKYNLYLGFAGLQKSAGGAWRWLP